MTEDRYARLKEYRYEVHVDRDGDRVRHRVVALDPDSVKASRSPGWDPLENGVCGVVWTSLAARSDENPIEERAMDMHRREAERIAWLCNAGHFEEARDLHAWLPWLAFHDTRERVRAAAAAYEASWEQEKLV